MTLKRNIRSMQKLLGIDGLLSEAGFQDAIQALAAEPPQSDWVTQVPAEGLLKSVQAIVRNGPDAAPGETSDWHREKSASHAGKAATHKDQAVSIWKSDPTTAADHLLKSIEHDVRQKYHAQHANGGSAVPTEPK